MREYGEMEDITFYQKKRSSGKIYHLSEKKEKSDEV